MEVYEIVKTIGGGSFGQVYLAKHKREDKLYVIKRIKTRDMAQKDREQTENEVRLLQKLRHANIVAYKDSFIDREQFLNIVMIYCEGGDMYSKIKAQKGKNFSENQILDWMAQIILALHFLHEKKILHRDLKTQNIFLKNGRIRLGDFGIAKVLDSTRDFANTCIGTPYYMSPEIFKYKPYSFKSDVWALGCVLYEMCNLRHAFDAQTLNGLAVKILKGKYPPISTTYSKQFRDLVGKMLSINPKHRPTIWEIMNKPMVKRRIISFMTEVFGGVNPEQPHDVDDMYLDSLREQAEKLGIFTTVQQNIQLKAQGIQSNSNENDESLKPNNLKKQERDLSLDSKIQQQQVQYNKKLQKHLAQQSHLQEKIQYLEQKKQNIQDQEGDKPEQQQIPVNNKKILGSNQQSQQQQQQPERTNQMKRQSDNFQFLEKNNLNNNVSSTKNERKERSYSLERDNSHQQDSKKAEKGKRQFNIKVKQTPQIQSSKSSLSTNLDSLESGDSQVSIFQQQKKNLPAQTFGSDTNNQAQHQKLQSQSKQIKKEQEEKRYQEQFKAIAVENAKNRKFAQLKMQAQYRPSTGMKQIDIIAQGQQPYQEGKVIAQQLEDDQLRDSNLDQKQQQQSENCQQQLQETDQQEVINEDYEQPHDDNQNNPNQNVYQNQNVIKEVQNDQKNNDEDNEYYDENYEEDENYNEEEEKDRIIPEAENEEEDESDNEDVQKITQKLDTYKQRLKENTIKIKEIQDSIKYTHKVTDKQKAEILNNQNQIDNNAANLQEDAKEQSDQESMEEQDDDQLEQYNEYDGEIPPEGKLNQNPQYYKIQDRIKLIKHRCEAGLGNVIYEKAYQYLKTNKSQLVPDEIRKQMQDILGSDMVGFWHLIDQVLVLESILQSVQQYLPKN